MATTTDNPVKGLVLAIACLAQFMVVLDVAIVNVALPAMQVDLDLTPSTLQWVVVAYSLVLGGFLLLGGRLGDLLGRRRVLISGLTLFGAASLLAGLAQTSETLVGARALQGFGAALVAPSALSILAVTFAEGRERNWALGIFGAVGGSSASVGVIASGLLTDGPGWRWIFFINIPIGIALIVLAATVLPRDQSATAGRRHFDVLGAATVTAGLLLFVYGLNRGVDHGWTSAGTLAMFTAAAAMLVAFGVIEARSKVALVPPSALRNRTMIAADVSGFLLFGGFFAFIFLGSLMMQQLLAYSPTRAGAGWLATSLTAFVAAGVTGARLVGTLGVRKLLVAGPILLAAGVVWLTRVPADAAYLTDLLPGFVVVGLAIGLSAPAVQVAALSGVAPSSAGLASGLVETMREIGGAVGIAAASTVLVSQTREAIASADPVVRRAAAVDGFRSAFAVIVAFAVLAAVAAALGFARRAGASATVVGAAPQQAAVRPIGYWLRQAERAYARHLDVVLARRGLTRSQWRVLELARSEPPVSRRRLRAALPGPAARLDEALAGLVEDGLVRRRRTSEGTHGVCLTEEGAVLRRRIRRDAGLVDRRAVDGLDAGAHDAAVATLERIVANLNRPRVALPGAEGGERREMAG